VLVLDAPCDDKLFSLGTYVAYPSVAIPKFDADHPAGSIPNPMNAIHFERSVVLYVDGHVKSVPYGQLLVKNFLPKH